MTGGIITALIAVVGAVIFLVVYLYGWNSTPEAIVTAAATIIWATVSLPVVLVKLVRDERAARLKAEEELAREKREKAPALHIKAVEFRTFSASDLTPEAYHDLEQRMTVPPWTNFRYFALIELENFGAPTRAANWEFGVTHQGIEVTLLPEVNGWPQPLNYSVAEPLLADRLDREYFFKERLYTIVLYLTCSAILTETDFASFTFSFVDSNNQKTTWPSVTAPARSRLST